MIGIKSTLVGIQDASLVETEDLAVTLHESGDGASLGDR
jgi:hypothetical protein